MRPICRRRKIASFVWSRAQMSVPSTSTWPELGVSTPPRMCSSVDLPEPEGPTMATNSPFSTLKLTRSMALICVSPFPYTFERLCTLRISILCLQRMSVVPLDELARRVRVRGLPDTVLAHALGELHRLLMSGGGVVAAAAAGAGLGRCVRTARGDQGDHGKGASVRSVLLMFSPRVW